MVNSGHDYYLEFVVTRSLYSYLDECEHSGESRRPKIAWPKHVQGETFEKLMFLYIRTKFIESPKLETVKILIPPSCLCMSFMITEMGENLLHKIARFKGGLLPLYFSLVQGQKEIAKHEEIWTAVSRSNHEHQHKQISVDSESLRSNYIREVSSIRKRSIKASFKPERDVFDTRTPIFSTSSNECLKARRENFGKRYMAAKLFKIYYVVWVNAVKFKTTISRQNSSDVLTNLGLFLEKTKRRCIEHYAGLVSSLPVCYKNGVSFMETIRKKKQSEETSDKEVDDDNSYTVVENVSGLDHSDDSRSFYDRTKNCEFVSRNSLDNCLLGIEPFNKDSHFFSDILFDSTKSCFKQFHTCFLISFNFADLMYSYFDNAYIDHIKHPEKIST